VAIKNILFFILLALFVVTAKGQSYLDLEKKGDSLFLANDFDNASRIFDSIFNQSVVSPSLFLKMAYMHESSGNFTDLMVVLNKFYKVYPSADIQLKIEEVAREYQLKGYNYTDFDYFAALYRQYYYFILLFFLVASGLYFSHLIIKKISGNPLSFRPLFFILILLFLLVIINFNLQPVRAIIKNSNTLIMSAPAAGSDLLEISSSGHRVNVLGQIDVWVEVEYENQICYIKSSDLEFIQ
jgi:hypothetical protein